MSVDEKDDIAWNLVALAFSIAGSFFTASGSQNFGSQNLGFSVLGSQISEMRD